MAANAGTLMLVGTKSGRTYTVDVYVPDAIATNLTFNPAGLAGTASSATYRIPMTENCMLFDISIAAAPAAVGATFQIDGAPIAGGVIRWANQLAANPNRAKMALTVAAGSLLSALQF